MEKVYSRPRNRKNYLEQNKDRLLRESATIEDTRRYILAGADVNAKDYEGRTALMNATMLNNIEQMKLLIAAGADVNAQDTEGHTAIMFVRSAETAQLLIDAGADVNAKNKNGTTITECCQFSIRKGTIDQYIWPDNAKEILAVIKQAEYDKEGLKQDNTLAQIRQKAAKLIDKKLGTYFSTIQIPEWAKKSEAQLAQAVENKNNNNKRKNAPLLARNRS